MSAASNPFAASAMAAGYASARPPVHPLVIARVCQDLGWTLPVARALDLGCGAGLSTGPLVGLARHCVGLEPAASMLRWTGTTAPGASFVVAAAEQLPFPDESVDVITAAGSLNYTALDAALAEARRVLVPTGVLIAYDFTPGRSFCHGAALDAWFDAFRQRCPRPVSEALVLDPTRLADAAAPGFRLASSTDFAFGLQMSAAAYEAYMLTETSVAAAVRRGESLEDIRAWCRSTLADVFAGDAREVVFRGYIAYLRR